MTTPEVQPIGHVHKWRVLLICAVGIAGCAYECSGYWTLFVQISPDLYADPVLGWALTPIVLKVIFLIFGAVLFLLIMKRILFNQGILLWVEKDRLVLLNKWLNSLRKERISGFTEDRFLGFRVMKISVARRLPRRIPSALFREDYAEIQSRLTAWIQS